MGAELSEDTPRVIQWLERWGLLAGVVVFFVGLVVNFVMYPAREWLPMAIVSAILGPAAYLMLAAIVRFQLWVRNPYMNRSRVTRLLHTALVFAAIFALMLIVGLIAWPRTATVNLFALAIPMGMALSVAHLWKQRSAFPERRV